MSIWPNVYPKPNVHLRLNVHPRPNVHTKPNVHPKPNIHLTRCPYKTKCPTDLMSIHLNVYPTQCPSDQSPSIPKSIQPNFDLTKMSLRPIQKMITYWPTLPNSRDAIASKKLVVCVSVNPSISKSYVCYKVPDPMTIVPMTNCLTHWHLLLIILLWVFIFVGFYGFLW